LIRESTIENTRALGQLNILKGLNIDPKLITGPDLQLLKCLPSYEDMCESVDFDRKFYFEAPNQVLVMLYIGRPFDLLDEGFRVAVEIIEPQKGIVAGLRNRFLAL